MKATSPHPYFRRWALLGPICVQRHVPCLPHTHWRSMVSALRGETLACSRCWRWREALSASGCPRSRRACFPCQAFLVASALFRNSVFLFSLTTPISVPSGRLQAQGQLWSRVLPAPGQSPDSIPRPAAWAILPLRSMLVRDNPLVSCKRARWAGEKHISVMSSLGGAWLPPSAVPQPR